jgi:tRNA threonylcarbamoyl adenosine modification protein YeaZ
MNVLAIDATTGQLALAYASAAEEVEEVHHLGRQHSTQLLPAVARLLEGRSPPDVVAVASGPGSYTGIRIGMASAEGLARGFGCQAVAVPTFTAWVEPYRGKPRVVLAMDARGGRVFAAVVEGGREVVPTDLYPAEAIAPWAKNSLLVSVEEGLFPEAKERRQPGALGLAAVARRWVACGTVPAFVPYYVRPPAVERARTKRRGG